MLWTRCLCTCVHGRLSNLHTLAGLLCCPWRTQEIFLAEGQNLVKTPTPNVLATCPREPYVQLTSPSQEAEDFASSSLALKALSFGAFAQASNDFGCDRTGHAERENRRL